MVATFQLCERYLSALQKHQRLRRVHARVKARAAENERWLAAGCVRNEYLHFAVKLATRVEQLLQAIMHVLQRIYGLMDDVNAAGGLPRADTMARSGR